MKAWFKYVGLMGLLLILISVFIRATTSSWSWAIWILIIIGLGLIAVYLAAEHRQVKEFFATRSFKQSSNITVMSLTVFGIILLINIILFQHNYRWDTTKAKLFSISPQSKKIVRSLKDDVAIKAFFRPSNQQNIRDLFAEYANQSSRFKYEIIDPDVNPGLVKQYNVESYGIIIFEHKGKIERIKQDTEQEITNALIKVTREGQKKIYFTTMHGEAGLEDINPEGLTELKKALEKENYKAENIFLAEKDMVPEDCAVLVIAGPKKDLLDIEYKEISAYVNKGGKLLVLLDPDEPDLNRLLGPWGFEIGDNTVIDTSPVGQLFGAGYGSPLITKYESHPITDNFNLMTIFRLARSVTPASKPDSGITVKSLARTNDFPASWAETNLNVNEIRYDEGKDLKGPISIAAVAEKDISLAPDTISESASKKQLTARIAVFGDSDFMTNAFFHFQGNGDLVLNVISWLAEQGDLISIRAKAPEDNRLSLSAQQSQIIFWFGVVLLPLSILVVGIVVYMQRK